MMGGETKWKNHLTCPKKRREETCVILDRLGLFSKNMTCGLIQTLEIAELHEAESVANFLESIESFS